MNDLKVFKDMTVWRKYRETLGQKIELGLVPTMGALHEGHLSLIRKSISENEKTIVSIYVNPTQFNDKNDFKNYPVDLDQDLDMLKNLGVDYVINPVYEQMYPDNYRFRLTENNFSKLFCGKDRPGHFDGVLTIVMKLFNMVKPTRAYFGEKDFQQLTLIKDMVESFFMDVYIVSLPTLREHDGLAMSSRNVLLNEIDRKLAPWFNKILKMNISADEAKKRLEENGFAVDYVEDYNNRRLAAVRLGKVRLIDNEKI